MKLCKFTYFLKTAQTPTPARTRIMKTPEGIITVVIFIPREERHLFITPITHKQNSGPKTASELGAVVDNFNPCTQEAEAGEDLC